MHRLFNTTCVVLVIGCALLRFFDLQHYPPYIHNDEAYIPLFGMRFMDPINDWALKGSSYGGHPNFGVWLVSLPAQILGTTTIWTGRLGVAFIGLLSLILFAWAIALAHGRTACLLFLAFGMTFHLHLHYSRTAFQYNSAILAAALVSFSCMVWMRAPRWWSALLVGISVGLSMLMYSASHVLPPSLAMTLALVWLFPPRKDTPITSRIPPLSCGTVLLMLIGFFAAFGLQLHDWLTAGYASRLDSQFFLAPSARRHLELNIGHPVGAWELLFRNVSQTLRFFVQGDSAGQYSFRGPLLSSFGSSLALTGLLVLAWRAAQREVLPLFIIIASSATLMGSSIMVEANFSPHLILFALAVPYACAIGLSTLMSVLPNGVVWLKVFISVAISIWWTHWNLNAYRGTIDRQGYARWVWMLNLPVKYQSVKTIINFTSIPEPFSESHYQLVYPNAERLTLSSSSAENTWQALLPRLQSQTCPCLFLIPEDQSGRIGELLQAHGSPYSEHKGRWNNMDFKATVFEVSS